MTTRRVYVNAASLIPWSLGSGGPDRAIEMANKAHFNGLQLLPLRGWNVTTMSRITPPDVVAYENAWNSGTLMGALSRHLGKAGEEQPLLWDWAFFGSKPLETSVFAQLFPRAFNVVHEPMQDGVYEINPEGGFPKLGKTVVWDTLHVQRARRDGEVNRFRFGEWRSLLAQLSGQICLIHVHPTAGSETESLLTGGKSELRVMMRALNRYTTSDIPVVVEVAPKLLATQRGATEYLNRIRERICELLV